MKLFDMDVGFDTVGNATLICYDQAPVLVTDPWVVGSAYFGSWGLTHKVPDEQLEAIKHCEYVWISHGHPDHLNADSESYYLNKKILLPDHVGGRIYKAFKEAGLDVSILKDHKWYQLSDRIRVLCMADYNQDGILLIDINGRLLVNMNDAYWGRGWLRPIRKIVKQYDQSFLLCIIGHGDADMINVRNEDGDLILPCYLIEKQPLGDTILRVTQWFGTKAFIPFSCMHRYQREDSAWVNEHLIELDESLPTQNSPLETLRILPGFIRYDCQTDKFEEIRPPLSEGLIYAPDVFGDHWSDELEKGELQEIVRYFKAIEHLYDAYGFINMRVGGKDNYIDFNRRRQNHGLTFEVPRHSLMEAIRNHVFDDLLIGNYMRTTLHGRHSTQGLFPHFTPYVARYADNGNARTNQEVNAYMAEYRRRSPDPVGFLATLFANRCKNLLRPGSQVRGVLKNSFRRLVSI